MAISTGSLIVYFTAEKQAAVVIGILGVISCVFAAYLWFSKSSFKAMAWPLVIIGAAQLAIGIGLFIRTDPQINRLQEGLQTNPKGTVAPELSRMEKVNRSFKIIEMIEVLFIIAGICMALFLLSRNLTWASVGMGLFVQAAVVLVFDLFAEHRALVYTRWLADLSRNL
jgi:hypothetical protein